MSGCQHQICVQTVVSGVHESQGKLKALGNWSQKCFDDIAMLASYPGISEGHSTAETCDAAHRTSNIRRLSGVSRLSHQQSNTFKLSLSCIFNAGHENHLVVVGAYRGILKSQRALIGQKSISMMQKSTRYRAPNPETPCRCKPHPTRTLSALNERHKKTKGNTLRDPRTPVCKEVTGVARTPSTTGK